jgi:serine/threonine protein kinase
MRSPRNPVSTVLLASVDADHAIGALSAPPDAVRPSADCPRRVRPPLPSLNSPSPDNRAVRSFDIDTDILREDTFSVPCSSIYEGVQQLNLAYADLRLGDILGAGQFGTVFAVSHAGTPHFLAAKRLNSCEPSCKDVAARELLYARISRMNQGNGVSRHLVNAYGVCHSIPQATAGLPRTSALNALSGERSIHIVMEYMDRGSLADVMLGGTPYAGRVDDKVIASTVLSVVCGLRELNARRVDADSCVMHCDLKPANLMLNSAGVLKVGDFGCMRVVGDDKADCGTTSYMSPERLYSIKVKDDPASDIWSLGCIVYELACGVHPFHTSKGVFGLQKAQQSFKVPESIEDPLRTLIEGMLTVDPAKRITRDEILASEFMRTFQGLREHYEATISLMGADATAAAAGARAAARGPEHVVPLLRSGCEPWVEAFVASPDLDRVLTGCSEEASASLKDWLGAGAERRPNALTEH